MNRNIIRMSEMSNQPRHGDERTAADLAEINRLTSGGSANSEVERLLGVAESVRERQPPKHPIIFDD